MNTTKLWIIIRREYLNIVQKKSFLLATFLVPIGILIFAVVEIASFTVVEKEQYQVLLPKEKASIFQQADYSFTNTTDLTFEIVDQPLDSIKRRVQQNEDELWINPPNETQIKEKGGGPLAITSTKTLSDGVKREIRKQVEKRIRTYRQQKEGISDEQLENLDFDLDVSTTKIDKKTGEESKGFKYLTKIIGAVMGMAIYMLVAIYGQILMQTVIDEKSNRIVEVIVSSVKPFQLLLGKTIALISVAMTQMLIWGVLSVFIYMGAAAFLAGKLDPSMAPELGAAGTAQVQNELQNFMLEIKSFNWGVVWIMPIFFIGGFFLYGSLYAAVGSAVDNIQDAQQLVFPISLPLILSMFVGINIIQNPNSTLAVVSSYIPFFSPLTMPVRVATTDVPWWEVMLSIITLVLGFLACIWVAAKIYRTGILMYGKKPKFKELIKWIRTS